MADWIGETTVSDTGWEHLEALVDIGNRMAGNPGEREAAEATADALRRVGARDVRLDSFDIQGWRRGESAIRAGGTAHDCIALPRSPDATAAGELVDLGHGLPEDFADADLDGAVAIASSDVPSWYDRYIHRREKYYRAVEAGAAAFVYANHIEGQLPPTGSVGTDEAPIGEIPAVGVSRETGARLRRRFEGEPVTLEVAAEIGEATSRNVHAELGPDTGDRVLVTSHVDAHDIAEGAGDNAAGTAMLVEVARALAAREDDLETRVEFVAYGAEEVGLRGSGYHARTTDLGSVVAVLNNDGVVTDRDLSFTTHGFEGLAAAVRAVADALGHPAEAVPRQSPHSDHWPFVRRGVPGYHVSSGSEGGGRGWGHTEADTLDKLDRRNLREQAVFLVELAVYVASSDCAVSRKDPDAIARALEEEGLAAGMRLVGDWPYGDG